uniref:lachesin-like isoform X2 n=1 Tax=Vespula vulgaris TaxID=7454 RepID=UPI002122B599|nr:lachesin-like isoform X2 [Vespula vulgaris]
MSGQTRRSACIVEEEARADRTVQMILVLAAIVTFLGVDGMGHAVVAAYPAVGHVSTGKTAFHQESLSLNIGPIIVAPVGNQTAAVGREVVFSCSVRNIGKFKVAWLRASDQTVLTVHTRTVTHNARISVSYETGSNPGSGATSGAFGVTGSSQATEEVVNGTWRLHIRQLKESDRDCYMCQINTSPMKSELGCVDILVPPDIVYGGETTADLAVSEGDNATLSCRATGRPTPRVSWRREDGDTIFIRASSTVAPTVTVPNQLLGAPLGTEVTLKCYVEAFPNTINYWVKNHRGTNDEMLLEGPKYSVREERSGYKVLMELAIKGFTEQDVGSYKCISTNSLGRADGTLRLYEIKIGFDRTSRGKDHVSIIGGLAEAAQSSGASNAGGRAPGYTSSLSHILSMFLFIPVLWPR